MKFSDFCTDLQDLVMLFAWNVPMSAVDNTFAVLSELKSMDVPWFFLRGRVWSWHYHKHLPSPTIIFMPLEYFSGNASDLINHDVVYYFLFSLDFRKQDVKIFGPRTQWVRNISENWRTIGPFAEFYRLLLHCKGRLLKKADSDIFFLEAELCEQANRD